MQLGRAKAESGYTNFWLGSIDEVRIYDRALSADEIPALAGRPATEELFLPLDEGSGSTVTDASGGYRIGTVGSAGSWTDGRADPDGNRARRWRSTAGPASFPSPARSCVPTRASPRRRGSNWPRPTPPGGRC